MIKNNSCNEWKNENQGTSVKITGSYYENQYVVLRVLYNVKVFQKTQGK